MEEEEEEARERERVLDNRRLSLVILVGEDPKQ